MSVSETSKLRTALLSIALAALITLSASVLPLDFLEAPLFDLRHKMTGNPPADSRITLITLDEITATELNDVLPLSLEKHADLIEKLENLNPAAIGYLVDFNQVERISEINKQDDTFQRISQAGVRMNVLGLPFLLGIPFDQNGEVLPPQKLQALPHAVALIHKDGNTFGKDRVSRRALLNLFGRSAFELNLVSRAFTAQDYSLLPGRYHSREAEADYFYYRAHAKDKVVFNSSYDTFPYNRISALDLLRGKVDPALIKDKVVLVGTYEHENPNNQTLIPNGLQPLIIPNILVHANILDSILNQQGIRRIPVVYMWLLIFLSSWALIQASFSLRPTKLLSLVAISLLTWTLGASIAFMPIRGFGGLWIPLAAPLFSMVVSFYLLLPVRLYMEHRKRGQLEEQNRLLLEVEEMKTNFLQLITHDLKTPIAKVQGLAENLQRVLQPAHDSKENELIRHMLAASDELNHFVNSLLELSRLDTQGLRVQLQSKDINQVLEQVIEKHHYSAQAKSIVILTEFEPLFPIKVDTTLIAKVLSNLLDNAIKYSPENTSILIETKEVDTFVEISIRDQGIGIPDTEIKHLFQRFHRIKNSTTQRVKGTGLGLYLSKYFIEAHHGQIMVESAAGQGTKFTIRLPLDLSDSVVNPGLKTELPTPKETAVSKAAN